MTSNRPDARFEFNPTKQAAGTEAVAVRTSADALGPPVVPDHEMIGRIGCGAFGEVWLARNVMGTLRAVKVVHRRNFSEVYPFEREFNGIQKYEPVSRSHEGLVDILQIGRNEEAGYFYSVMELAEPAPVKSVGSDSRSRAGASFTSSPATDRLTPAYVPRTLRHDLQHFGRLPPTECLRIALRLSRALDHLHRHGLVHRDIKPSNIIFVNGEPKLADIGLVADLDEARSFVGTIGFIPPEGPGTAQADVYGLGKVLYEALTGRDRQEFPALPEEFLGNGRELDSPSGIEVGRDSASMKFLVAELNQVILRACESDPRRRYPSAQAMGDDLHRLEQGQSIARARGFRQWLSLGKRAGMALATMVQRSQPTDVSSGIAEVNHLVEKGHHGNSPPRTRVDFGAGGELAHPSAALAPPQFQQAPRQNAEALLPGFGSRCLAAGDQRGRRVGHAPTARAAV